MDRARERDCLPRKLFPLYRSVGIGRGDILRKTPPRQHGKRRQGRRRRAHCLDEAAPAGRSWTDRQRFRQLFTWSHKVAPAGDPPSQRGGPNRDVLPLAIGLAGRSNLAQLGVPVPVSSMRTAAVFSLYWVYAASASEDSRSREQ